MDIDQIKKAIKEGRINITEHADEELANDNISNELLYQSVLNGEIIEDYPNDFPFPSCLILGKDEKGRPIHSVWAFAEKYNIAILITAYIPAINKWVDYKRRK
ncbi:MAG: DUF4258 domain-containing protein [Euryarchaeota archaeon]|nr:DUF4258 domain-containing protein [Euryarchaeota archaeon]